MTNTKTVDHYNVSLNHAERKLRALLEVATTENRGLDDTEREEVTNLNDEIEGIRTSIKEAEVSERSRAKCAELRSRMPDLNKTSHGPNSVDARGSELREHPGASWLVTENRGLSTALGLGDAVTPPEHSNYVWDRLAEQTVGLRSGFTQLNTERERLIIPRVTADATSGWVSEGDPIAKSEPVGDDITAVPSKVAVIVESTREAIETSSPALLDIIAANLIRSLSLTMDYGFFEGTGTDAEITGLANTAGITDVSMGTNGAAFADLDPIADAIGALESANATATAIVMHPRTWNSLLKLKESTGSNKPIMQASAGSAAQGVARSVYGVPVYLSAQLSTDESKGTNDDTSSVYVMQADQCAAVFRGPIRVDTSPYAAWDNDKMSTRAMAHVDLVVPNPAAVARITGVRVA